MGVSEQKMTNAKMLPVFDDDQPIEIMEKFFNEDEQNIIIKEDECIVNGVSTTNNSAVKYRGICRKHIRRFERRYTELGPRLKPEQKTIDYILVYENKTSKDEEDQDKRKSLKRKEDKRESFENAMKLDGFLLQRTTKQKHVILKIHCPFKRLCAEAEIIKLEMPLSFISNWKPESSCFKTFIGGSTPEGELCAPFVMDKIHKFKNYDDPTHFFRSSTRTMLVHHILMNLDIRSKEDKENGIVKMNGLPYFLKENIYTDAFPLHEESSQSQNYEEKMKKRKAENIIIDSRTDLDETWSKWFRFQPLWEIRNYFGEKIALYFAWTGMVMTYLWILTILGVGIFLYGFIESLRNGPESIPINANATDFEIVQNKMEELLSSVRHAFDNNVTPYFALITCLWGTLVLELWKRTNATLAYKWHVNNYEINQEPNRAEYEPYSVKTDPITGEEVWSYPFKKLVLRYTGSILSVVFLICIVCCCVISIIVYRVWATVHWCPDAGKVGCLVVTTVLSSVMNGITILILGQLYDKLAEVLTKLENHRTQSRYDDSLIIKVFAFQFVNSYASCFYIAFYRGRFDINIGGESYPDICSNTCMSQLSFQVIILMLLKPFPKFLEDIIIPTSKKFWRNRLNWCCRFRCFKCCQNKVDDEEAPKDQHKEDMGMHYDYVEEERRKTKLGDYTLEEYSEKVIQYGYLMLFASAFPLAPLLALLTNAVDIRIDCKRLLWMYKRPVAEIRSDIGKWYGMLQFLNICGVITNGLIIVFTSSWGENYTTTEKLWIFIGFEHIVFTLKFLIAYLIPDVPSHVAEDSRREKNQAAKFLGKSKLSMIDMKGLVNYSDLVPKDRTQSQIIRLQRKGSSLYKRNESIVEEGNNSETPDKKSGTTLRFPLFQINEKKEV